MNYIHQTFMGQTPRGKELPASINMQYYMLGDFILFQKKVEFFFNIDQILMI